MEITCPVLAQRAKSKLLALPGSMPITGSMQIYFVYKFYLYTTVHLFNNYLNQSNGVWGVDSGGSLTPFLEADLPQNPPNPAARDSSARALRISYIG